MRTLIIDNYDSFTFNLYQLIARVSGDEPIVLRNDQVPWSEIRHLPFDSIVLSPGPGRPDVATDFGVCTNALLEAEVPILGVCLGHQGIAQIAGARIVRAPSPMHGRISEVKHTGTELFAGIPQQFQVVRYHSLVARSPLPETLEPTAWTNDGILMALRHRTRPVWGVQFHPESISTEYGERLIENFCALVRRRSVSGRWSVSARSASVVPMPSTTPRRREEVELRSRKLDWMPDPELAFVALYGAKSPSFWLDSSLVKEGLSRFSFMGDATGPLAQHIGYRTATKEIAVTEDGRTTVLVGDLFEYLRDRLASFDIPPNSLPFDFHGGFVGYLGYELKADCGAAPGPASTDPDAQLVFADRFVAFDAEERAAYLVALLRPGDDSAEAWFDETEATLAALTPRAPPPDDTRPPPPEFDLARSRATYLEDVHECLNRIRAGETYEVCLTNQIHGRVTVDPLTAYRTLRRTDPAPYAAFLSMHGLSVVCSSPERFLRVERSMEVEAKPIKGTARRGDSPEEDERLKDALRRSDKDRSENLMIVDLVRNDIGLVSAVGSVVVPKLMDVETYATVHQLVSTIRGRLRESITAVDAVRACFPGGSMTGAPKKRTMQIIDELERAPRGVYSGSIGYFSVSGPADFNIVIRSAVLRDGEATIGVGGAVVALSEPDAEFEETLLKSKAILRALVTSSRPTPDAETLVESIYDRWRMPERSHAERGTDAVRLEARIDREPQEAQKGGRVHF